MPFRLEKELMPFRRRKLHDLVFDGRTVARSARRDRAAVHRRARDVVLDDLLSRLAEEGDPAWHLLGMPRVFAGPSRLAPEVRPRVIELLDLALLSLHHAVIDGPSVDARRCSCLEPLDDETDALELLGEMRR